MQMGRLSVGQEGASVVSLLSSRDRDRFDQRVPSFRIQQIDCIESRYRLKGKIGKGFMAAVHAATPLDASDAPELAVKVVAKSRLISIVDQSYFRMIYERLGRAPHPNVVQLHGVYENGQAFHAVMEKCSGTDLVEFVLQFTPSTIPESHVRNIMCQLLRAVDHLHRHNVVHRDIKLDNIIYDARPTADGRVVLIDFDLALLLDRREPPTPIHRGHVQIVGTKEYNAPEAFRGRYSVQTDLWQCGVILYILMDGHFPFDLSQCNDGTFQDCLEVVKKGPVFRPDVMARFPDASDLVQSLLAVPTHRRCPSAQAALSHRWFQGECAAAGHGDAVVGAGGRREESSVSALSPMSQHAPTWGGGGGGGEGDGSRPCQ
uniref:Protein kinase domain-containing protein n=1 Tax=Vitrella brassicaformis TaxID=1169539 RepID=A0A7S1KDK4_9ALVE